MHTSLKVIHAENGVALIQFIAGHLGLSRNKAKGIIDQRRVFVNGRRVWMARHRLKTGDIITGFLGLEQPAGERPIPVIYEDNDYLIVDKPAGIESNGKDSVEELLNKQAGSKTVTACHAPCMACHRLDQDTSGCLIFAKHLAAKERIIPLFASHKIIKFYQTIVTGHLTEKSFSITKPLEGQKAVTHVQVTDTTPAASHVSVQIETGRMHQIRKHLASIGHPVLGDQQYGGNRAASPLERSIPRQMLHAAEIKFTQPFSGLPVHGKSPLPADIRDCLQKYHLK